MGRSLFIDQNGLNVAFAAGTGILPFMDLIGFLARDTLKINEKIGAKSTLEANFFLWFCVRLNSAEAIGHDLMQSLERANSK